jgi:hypothetical protein
MNKDSPPSHPDENTAKPGRTHAAARVGLGCVGPALVVTVGSVFVLAGSLFLYFAVAKPLFQCLAAKSWVPTPCVVLSSRVVKGKAFHLAISYAYEFNGQQHQSSHYQFGEWGSPSSRGKKAIVARYPRGWKAVCYVNPKDPAEAVLDRDLHWAMLWNGLFLLQFVAVGAAILCFALLHVRKKPVSSRVGFFLFSLAFAIVFNEVMVVLASQQIIPAWHASRRVSLSLIGQTVILVLLGSIGLVSLVMFLFALVGLFKPRHKGGRKGAVPVES